MFALKALHQWIYAAYSVADFWQPVVEWVYMIVVKFGSLWEVAILTNYSALAFTPILYRLKRIWVMDCYKGRINLLDEIAICSRPSSALSFAIMQLVMV